MQQFALREQQQGVGTLLCVGLAYSAPRAFTHTHWLRLPGQTRQHCRRLCWPIMLGEFGLHGTRFLLIVLVRQY